MDLGIVSILHYEPWESGWGRLAEAAANEGVLFTETVSKV